MKRTPKSELKRIELSNGGSVGEKYGDLIDAYEKKIDVMPGESLTEYINRIRKDGLTVLVVEQNVRMALLLSDYGYVIKDGVINVEGEAKKLINDKSVEESYLGGTRANV